MCQALPLEELCKVDHILIGHSHFDHVKDLPLLADLIVGRRDKPVTIWASVECAKTLRDSIFNNSLWPDFTRIPTRKNLKAVLLETSFPNKLQQLADISGHLTPQTLESELKKFNRNGTEVFLYHLKPAFVPQLKDELKS